MTRILLSDHGGDFDAFCDACYEAYQQFWLGSPMSLEKRIVRHRTLGENNRESVFWGIVEGHDDQRQFDTLERYEKIPCLAYMAQAAVSEDADVRWFRIRQNGKLRLHVFSQTHRYLMVLQERRDVFDFITAHPLSARQLEKKLKQYTESLGAENGIL